MLMSRIRWFLRALILTTSLTLLCLVVIQWIISGPGNTKLNSIRCSDISAPWLVKGRLETPTDWEHPMSEDDVIGTSDSAVPSANIIGASSDFNGSVAVVGINNVIGNKDRCSASVAAEPNDLVILAWNARKWFNMNGRVSLPADNDVRSGAEKCPNSPPQPRTCTFTDDRRLYRSSVAVLILGDVAIFPRDFPPSAAMRPRAQKWIYYSRESPGMNVYYGSRYSRLRRQATLYNLTSTYSLRSDIPHPYTSETCEAENIPTSPQAEGMHRIGLR